MPENASHLTKDIYKDPNGYWYGIYTGLLGFMVNTDELARLGLEAPKSWDDLLKDEYKGLIWLSNYNTAGTPKLVANLMVQLKGHDEGIQYLVDLDKNIQVYTKSGSGPSKNVGTGECVIGIGFLHDGITQIVDNGYENVALVVPADGTACEVGPVAIFTGAAHPNAARLFMEYALSPDCVELAADHGSYQFLVIDNATQPQAAIDFGLDPSLVWDGYDFAKAATDTAQNVEDVMAAIAADGADTTVVLRPESTVLAEEGFLPVKVTLSCFMGAYQLYHVLLGDTKLIIHEYNPKNKRIFQQGEDAYLSFASDNAHCI